MTRTACRFAMVSMLCVLPTGVWATVDSTPVDDTVTPMGDGRLQPAGPGPIEAPLAPPPREVQFEHDVPAQEVRLGAYLEPVPAYDRRLNVFANAAGEVAALVLEDYQLQALYSADGGTSWDSEVVVSGGHGAGAITEVHAWFDGTGTLYVATDAADPDGSCGLQFFKSVDMGRSWSGPVQLVVHGDDTHGIRNVRVGANAAGRIAVAYIDGWSGDPYVRVSSDAGATWTGRVRIDPGVAEGTHWAVEPYVLVDSNGIVHATYTQDRTSGWTPDAGDTEILYTRSTDGGATFESERSMDSVLPVGERIGAHYPKMALAADGSLLVTFWDAYSTDRLYVVRSTDGGASFQMTLNQTLSNTNVARAPFLAPSPDDGTVFVILRQSTGSLWIQRSADYGATFGGPTTLAVQANALNRFNVARTPGGAWVVAWEDRRNDGYAQWMTDVYVRVSTDDGWTWGTEQRANSGAPGGSSIFDVHLAPVGSGGLIVGYLDCRASNGADCDVWVNTSPAVPLAFGPDRRIDSDREMRSVYQYNGVQVAADAAGHVYAAIPVIRNGPYKDLYLVRSDDGGYTFHPAQRVSTVPEGQFIVGNPVIAATSDGHVHVAYKSRLVGGAREVRINSSADFGASWLAADVFLGYGSDSSDFGNHPQLDVAAVPGGNVYVVWSETTNVFFARSTDGGATFSLQIIDQAATDQNQPSICAQGARVVVVFKGDDTVWAVTSDDGGVTWAPRWDLRRPTVAGDAAQPAVACGDTDKAVAVWTDSRNGVYEVFSSRYDGASWGGSVRIGDPMPWNGQFYPVVGYASTSQIVAAYHQFDSSWFNLDLSTYAVASGDGGQTFGAPARLDTDLRSGTRSVHPHLAGDGAGNAWVAWTESSTYVTSMAVRYSGDGGQSWGEVRRLDRETPQGYFVNDTNYSAGDDYVSAVPGAAYFVWGGVRDCTWREAILQVYDLDDFDRDQSSTGIDCDDQDPGAWSVPVVVGAVAATKLPSVTRLTWTEQATTAGSGTRYEVVTGGLAELVSTGSYASAICLAADLVDPALDDDRTGPEAGQGYFYLIRAANGCGTAGFGDSTESPDPRDDLDATSPCP